MPSHCPLCQSKNISKSKRRGLLESLVLKLIHVRPYRCLNCDLRFFRRAVPQGHKAPPIVTTSTRSEFQGAMSPLSERERS
jgi:predicted Zn-ribbon and HTH transcriptional regulator